MVLEGFWLVLTLILTLIAGIAIGFFGSRFTMGKYFEKNPPITEELLISVMQSVGQTPNKKKINQMMKKIKQNKK